ncbi:MAG: DUF4214 domain-containing protein [Pseudomonadota bacterium]
MERSVNLMGEQLPELFGAEGTPPVDETPGGIENETPAPFDPDDVPFEELPFTSWVVGDPSTAGASEDEERAPATPQTSVAELLYTNWVVETVDEPAEMQIVEAFSASDITEEQLQFTNLDAPSSDASTKTDEAEGGSIAGLSSSTTAGIDDIIEQIYVVALGREAEEAGFTFWTDIAEKTGDFGAIAEAFVTSTEFEFRYGDDLKNDEFFDIVYENAFDEEASDDVEEFWRPFLGEDDDGRATIVNEFANLTALLEDDMDMG